MGKKVIAVDIGASSGKMAKSSFDGQVLKIGDYFDFTNIPVQLNGNFYWDIFNLYNRILEGMTYYANNNRIDSIGIDTFGASYGLLDKRGRLLELIYNYRDLRTEQTMDKIYNILPQKELFELTGCQPNRTYTLPQLYSYIEHDDKILDLAENMLFLPDLISYFLSGEIYTERSIAGTSSLLTSGQDEWAYKVFEALNIQTDMLSPIVDGGTQRGTILPEVANSTGIGKTKLIATVGHDTAAAVLGIPGFGINQVYVSIGTNINMGVELNHSVTSEKAYEAGYKNAGVLSNRKILYRDFSAFWILNELRRTWQGEGKDYDYATIMNMVLNCESKHVYIDLEDVILNNAGNNTKHKINDFLIRTNQDVLETDEEFARCILESIAIKVKYCIELLNRELNIPLHKVSIINGGTRNHVLMQMISDSIDMPIYCGLPYATITGNVLSQLYSHGELNSIEEIRELSRISFEMKEYQPKSGRKKVWDTDLSRLVDKGIIK